MKYKENYYGFVYIWFDRKKRIDAPTGKWCVGSRMGDINGSYITSTGHMVHAIKKRPDDFKRRILWYCPVDDNKILKSEEQRWLNMIKPDELSTRYYNIKPFALGGNPGPEACRKISEKLTGRPGTPHTEESRNKLSISHTGKKMRPESIEKMRLTKIGKKQSPESNEKRSLTLTGRKYPGRSLTAKHRENIGKGLKGRTLSDEHIEKLSASKKGKPSKLRGRPQSPEWIEKRALANTGKIPTKIECPHCKKMSAPGMHARWHGDKCREITA